MHADVQELRQAREQLVADAVAEERRKTEAARQAAQDNLALLKDERAEREHLDTQNNELEREIQDLQGQLNDFVRGRGLEEMVCPR